MYDRPTTGSLKLKQIILNRKLKQNIGGISISGPKGHAKMDFYSPVNDFFS